MLDIYAIDDSIVGIPEAPDGVQLIASLELDEHKSLRGFWDVCSKQKLKIAYFDDSRFTSADVVRMLEMLRTWRKQEQSGESLRSSAYAKVVQALSTVVRAEKGVVAYCD